MILWPSALGAIGWLLFCWLLWEAFVHGMHFWQAMEFLTPVVIGSHTLVGWLLVVNGLWLLYLPLALWPLWKSNLPNSRPLMLGIVFATLVLAGNHGALVRLERAVDHCFYRSGEPLYVLAWIRDADVEVNPALASTFGRVRLRDVVFRRPRMEQALERAGVEYLVMAEWPGIESSSGTTRYALVFHAPTLPYQVMGALKGVDGLDRLEGMGIIQF